MAWSRARPNREPPLNSCPATMLYNKLCLSISSVLLLPPCIFSGILSNVPLLSLRAFQVWFQCLSSQSPPQNSQSLPTSARACVPPPPQETPPHRLPTPACVTLPYKRCKTCRAESAEFYGKAVELAPAFSFAAANRALALYQLGNTNESMREMRWAPFPP
jgi:hypothetical protein